MRLINLESQSVCGIACFLAACAPTIFPSDVARIDFAEWGYAVVDEGSRPSCDETTHEVLDGPVVEIDGVWTQTYSVVPLPTAVVEANQAAAVARFAELKRQLVDQVDAHIAAIYARWMRFESEYTQREAAARAFAAGGYEGDPGVWVTSFATPAGLDLAAAADRIIEQADGLRGALQQLGALRMAKYGVQAAAGGAEALAAYEAIIAQANEIAGAL